MKKNNAKAKMLRGEPEGKRSGGNFATSFHGENYFEEANDEIFLSIQIETALGLNNAKEIMSTKGIDGSWIGPFDLAESLGIPFNSPEHFDAIEHIINVCKETNKMTTMYKYFRTFTNI